MSWQQLDIEVPRKSFIPDTIWVGDDLEPVSRRDAPDEWNKHVAANEPIVTAVEHTDDGDTFPASSCSMPSIVAEMLDALAVGPAHKVLEIGAGTGWNAALLSRRAAQVLSIEIDAVLAEQARQALKRTGHDVQVVTGDGLLGYPPAQPYDRIISTAAIRETVPTAWLEQLTDGGVLVTPWGTDWHNGVMLTLRAEPASDLARGRFTGNLAFMRVRSQRASNYGWEPADDQIAAADVGKSESFGADLDRILNPAKARFAIGARVPDVYLWTGWDVGGERKHVLDLDDGRTSSFARVHTDLTSKDPWVVRQLGPRRLWDEVESAYDWWHAHGEPGMNRFGMTVTPDSQWLWLDSEDQVVRRLAGRS